MVFAGANFVSVIFSILCAVAIGASITCFLCLIFDVKWDSGEGIGIIIRGFSMLMAAPFV